MAQRSHVPKFGNWESEENVPYTAYFDKARKGKSGGKIINPNDPQENPDIVSGGRIINPNDPQDNPDMLYDDKPLVQAPPFKTGAEPEVQMGPSAVRPRHERRSSREDADLRRPTDSPVHHDAAGRRASADLTHQRHGERGAVSNENSRRAARQSAGSDRSIEHSPLHPHHQGRVTGKTGGVSSPTWERKGSSEGSHGLAPSTPGRSRLGAVARGNETPDRGAAVPKFGEWDENNPASADGFTHIFNKVREERQSGTAKVPVMSTESSYTNNQKHNSNANSKQCCCFPWK